uniref:Uncharacterized protein n=2 Tax=Kalmanozyma brasiliensis (strain GHG001) TaxID=1365824 RepID=V5EQ85_KALBG
MARSLYYPCMGNVDLKTYIDARMYGLSFRRLHDEWVVLGKPRLDTTHWPRLIGHRGLPNSPQDFVHVAEYYDRKIFGQVLLMEQGKSANADRPLDDYLVSMVTTAAVVHADFVVHRFVRNQPAAEVAAAQQHWYHTFTDFLQDSVRHFINERRICDRLAPHQCVTPLLFGQASSMSYPDLLQAMHYQMQIFQNLFPNFGEHITRCAAAQPQQQWPTASTSASAYPSGQNDATSRSLDTRQLASTSSGLTDVAQQYEPDPSRPLSVVIIPPELEHRSDLYAATIDPSIRCDVPVERVATIIDSRVRMSASTSASSTSTPASMKASVPILSTRTTGSSFSSIASHPSSDAGSSKRKRREASELSQDGIESTSLVLRPPLQSHTSWSGETVGRSASEEYMITPDSASAYPSRSEGNPTSYFSSLPSTPTEGISALSTQDAAHPYLDRRPHRSSTTLGPLTSTSDSDSRKRSRAEQNREKMKAYHKRVMQQREALASVLADMTAHVGSVPLPPTRRSSAHSEDTSTTRARGSGTSEQSWSVTMRNKQKQESKARLRKREIEQVHELRLFASHAVTSLYGKGMQDKVGDADRHMAHAIVRVFARNRANWTALTSAEQRLMGEVAKLSLSEDEERLLRQAGSNEVIKMLIDRIQMEERTGTFSLSTESTPLLGSSSYDHRGGSSATGPFLTSGSTASRATSIQQFARQSGFSPSLVHPGSLMISPGSSEYGAVSPSGIPRPAGEEGGDYFGSTDRRRYASSRYSDASDAAPSVLNPAVSPGYPAAEQTSAHLPARSPGAGAMMSPPSVLAGSYGYNAMYAGGGAQQHRMNVQGMDRQTASGVGGQQTPSMEDAQLRMSTSYDGRGYGQTMVEGGSRMEPGTGIYHSQSMQAPSFGYPSSMGSHGAGHPAEGQQVYGLPSPSSTSTLQQYRSSSGGHSQYGQSYQQNPYDQQGPYGGQ